MSESENAAPPNVYFCETEMDALEEVRRRKASGHFAGMLVRHEKSPYGGFRVLCIPSELAIDELVEPILPGASIFGVRATHR